MVLTNNMCEQVLKQVMRFNNPKAIWEELHRSYDGIQEDRAYSLCLKFFSYGPELKKPIAAIISELKTIFSELQFELSQNEDENELPELVLIYKILDVLPQPYFSFRTGWMPLNKTEKKTVDNLTAQLCAYERSLEHGASRSAPIENIALTVTKKLPPKPKKQFYKTLVCNYCRQKGHIVRFCEKWIKDGRPYKSHNPPRVQKNSDSSEKPRTDNSSFMVISSVVFEASALQSSVCHDTAWYVDSGATHHVTNQRNIFVDFVPFSSDYSVITANGDRSKAIGQGTIKI